MDERGDVWFTSKVGPPENPAFCQDGSLNQYAKAFPLKTSNRGLAVYDPKTNTTKLIRTCFNTHHVVLAEDADNTVWVSAGGPQQGAIGWVDRKIWEETGDEAKAQGWAPIVIDTNGNGKVDDYVQPNQPIDPTKDKRLNAGIYGVGVNPADGTVWGSVLGFPGSVLRFDPKTKLSEVYEVPAPGFGPRGFDIDRNGVAYIPLSSGHLGAFDRRKCKGPLNGPEAAEGKLCPEGWTLTPFPGRSSATCLRAVAPRRATIPGLTSSTRPVSAPTFRWRPVMPTSRSWRWLTASGLISACHIRWASLPSISMAGSTIRTPAGKVVRCGRRTEIGLRSIARPARGRCRKWSGSRFGPTRWRTRPDTDGNRTDDRQGGFGPARDQRFDRHEAGAEPTTFWPLPNGDSDRRPLLRIAFSHCQPSGVNGVGRRPLILRSVKRHGQLGPQGKQRQQAKAKDQPATVDRVVAMGIPVGQQAMCEGVP